MREKGQLVKRGNLNSEGDVEFWNDESNENGQSKEEIKK